MRNKVTRTFITLLAVMLCMAAFSITALAADTTAQADTSKTTQTSSSNLLTPDGTGTVINDTTNGGGKEFLTITTPSKHVFYLIIDRQKGSENVYFLDAVTEKDLLALAQSKGEESNSSSASRATSSPETSSSPAVTTPTTSTSSHPKNTNNAVGIAVVVLILAAIAGAAIWFFKHRKPKNPSKDRADPDEYDFLEGEDNEAEPDDVFAPSVTGKPDNTRSETEDDE